MNIQTLIDKALEPSKEPRKRSGKFSPSSFGRCYRYQIWYRQDKTPDSPIDARTRRIFKVGDIFHDFVKQTILQTHPDAKTEVRIDLPDVLGFCDIELPTEVIEIKSQHSKGFWWMSKKGYDIKVEKYTNILQLMFYVANLNKDRGRLVYISKDDLCINEYEFSLNEYWRGEVDKELKTLREYWESGELPPAEPKAYNGKECKFCGYQIECKEVK